MRLERLEFYGRWCKPGTSIATCCWGGFVYGVLLFPVQNLMFGDRLRKAREARLAAEALSASLCEQNRRTGRRPLRSRPGPSTARRRKAARGARRDAALLIYIASILQGVNDGHGHPVGDEVLKHMVSELLPLRQPVPTGALGREEFVLVCLP